MHAIIVGASNRTRNDYINGNTLDNRKENLRTFTAISKVIPQSKQCVRCKIIKSTSDFSKSKICRDGLASWCKKCTSAYIAEKCRNDETFKKRLREKQNEWRKRNKDKCRISQIKAYRKKREEKISLEGYKPRAKRANLTCKLIQKHHETMKDDPEHLPTEFIQKIIGIKCKNDKSTSELISNGLH